MKSWQDFFDSYGVITQHKDLGGDGGDSMQRTCSYSYLASILRGLGRRYERSNYLDVIGQVNQFTITKGQYRRHPDKHMWYSREGISRDQLIPFIMVLGEYGLGLSLKDLFVSHLKRGLLFASNTFHNWQFVDRAEHELKSKHNSRPWNGNAWKLPDITGPDIWGLYIRAFKAKWAYPLLVVFDIYIFLDALFKRFVSNDRDCINMVLIFIHSQRVMPTPFSWLTKKIFPFNKVRVLLGSFFGRPQEPPLDSMSISVLKALREGHL